MNISFWSSRNNEKKSQPALRVAAYIMYVFFTFHFVLPLYINSSFLDSLVSETITSFVYAIAAVLAIMTMSATARALPRVGNYQLSLGLLITEVIAVLILSIPTAPTWVLLAAFICHWVLTAVIKFNFDIFLEKYSDDKTTGEIRGTLIMLNHIAYIAGPLIAGFILGEDAFWQMYLVSAVLVAPVIIILMKKFKNFADPDYTSATFISSLKHAWKDVNIRFILAAMFVLRLFFAWMVVYTPIYLHKYIGLPFSSVGIIFSIMLVPFVLFARPLGEIADRYLGEKEMLIAGFLITAAFTASLSFVTTSAIIVWAALLFGTRTGATMVQVMSEGYFFKHVESYDADAISVLRMIRPTAYIIGPLLASIMLIAAPFEYIFLGVAGVLLCGALIALPIVDTK